MYKVYQIAAVIAALTLFGSNGPTSAQTPQTQSYRAQISFPPVPPADETRRQREGRYASWRAANSDVDQRVLAFAAASEAELDAYAVDLDRRREITRSQGPYADLIATHAALDETQRQEAQSLFENGLSAWRAQQYDAAGLLFTRSLEIDPGQAAASYYLGDLLRRSDQLPEARDMMARVLALGERTSEVVALAEVALRTLPPVPEEPEAIRRLPPAIFDLPGRPALIWDCAMCPEMVVVPAGSYTYSAFARALIRPFAVGRFEVTNDEWLACVDGGGCISNRRPRHYVVQGSSRRHPVVNVSWQDAQEYAAWLSRTTGKSYVLLSDFVWEYASRAGTTTRYWWGWEASHEFANYGIGGQGLVSGRDQWLHTAPVGQFPPNAFGIFDTAGNVSEWVQECPADETDPCPDRLVRGGAWGSDSHPLLSAEREAAALMTRGSNVGFRIARMLP